MIHTLDDVLSRLEQANHQASSTDTDPPIFDKKMKEQLKTIAQDSYVEEMLKLREQKQTEHKSANNRVLELQLELQKLRLTVEEMKNGKRPPTYHPTPGLTLPPSKTSPTPPYVEPLRRGPFSTITTHKHSLRHYNEDPIISSPLSLPPRRNINNTTEDDDLAYVKDSLENYNFNHTSDFPYGEKMFESTLEKKKPAPVHKLPRTVLTRRLKTQTQKRTHPKPKQASSSAPPNNFFVLSCAPIPQDHFPTPYVNYRKGATPEDLTNQMVRLAELQALFQLPSHITELDQPSDAPVVEPKSLEARKQEKAQESVAQRKMDSITRHQQRMSECRVRAQTATPPWPHPNSSQKVSPRARVHLKKGSPDRPERGNEGEETGLNTEVKGEGGEVKEEDKNPEKDEKPIPVYTIEEFQKHVEQLEGKISRLIKSSVKEQIQRESKSQHFTRKAHVAAAKRLSKPLQTKVEELVGEKLKSLQNELAELRTAKVEGTDDDSDDDAGHGVTEQMFAEAWKLRELQNKGNVSEIAVDFRKSIDEVLKRHYSAEQYANALKHFHSPGGTPFKDLLDTVGLEGFNLDSESDNTSEQQSNLGEDETPNPEPEKPKPRRMSKANRLLGITPEGPAVGGPNSNAPKPKEKSSWNMFGGWGKSSKVPSSQAPPVAGKFVGYNKKPGLSPIPDSDNDGSAKAPRPKLDLIDDENTIVRQAVASASEGASILEAELSRSNEQMSSNMPSIEVSKTDEILTNPTETNPKPEDRSVDLTKSNTRPIEINPKLKENHSTTVPSPVVVSPSTSQSPGQMKPKEILKDKLKESPTYLNPKSQSPTVGSAEGSSVLSIKPNKVKNKKESEVVSKEVVLGHIKQMQDDILGLRKHRVERGQREDELSNPDTEASLDGNMNELPGIDIGKNHKDIAKDIIIHKKTMWDQVEKEKEKENKEGITRKGKKLEIDDELIPKLELNAINLDKMKMQKVKKCTCDDKSCSC